MMKEKYFVRKPIKAPSGWNVVISESRSPLSKDLETISFATRAEAMKGYAQIKRDVGEWL